MSAVFLIIRNADDTTNVNEKEFKKSVKSTSTTTTKIEIIFVGRGTFSRKGMVTVFTKF